MQLVENSILAALYQENSPDWLSELELVFLPQGQTLAIADAELQYVYFPTTAILSLCNLTED